MSKYSFLWTHFLSLMFAGSHIILKDVGWTIFWGVLLILHIQLETTQSKDDKER